MIPTEQDVERQSSTFELDEPHHAFQAVCRAFIQQHVRPLVEQSEQSSEFPHALWQLLGRHGFLGLGYPDEVGGSGGDNLSIALLSEELAKTSGGIAVTPLVSSYMAATHLVRFGTQEQQHTFLPSLVRGETVAAIAVTEPGTGSDVAAITTVATPEGNGYRIRGTKLFITNGGLADVLIVAAKTDAQARHHGITLFLVENGQEGFSVGRPLRKMGWHSSDTRELIFDNCFVSQDHIIGTVGRGFYQIMEGFQLERIVLAAMGLGLAQAAFDDALAYAKERQSFGQPIGKFQAVRHMLSQMATDIQAARLLTYQAASRMDAGLDAAEVVAMAKLFAARVANRVADDAVQIFGGYGFIEESHVAMHYRDARILRIGGGTDEVQMEILAKGLGL